MSGRCLRTDRGGRDGGLAINSCLAGLTCSKAAGTSAGPRAPKLHWGPHPPAAHLSCASSGTPASVSSTHPSRRSALRCRRSGSTHCSPSSGCRRSGAAVRCMRCRWVRPVTQSSQLSSAPGKYTAGGVEEWTLGAYRVRRQHAVHCTGRSQSQSSQTSTHLWHSAAAGPSNRRARAAQPHGCGAA